MTQLRIFINSLSLLSNRLIQGVATFALTTIIARNLGADKLGQYVLSVSFYYIFVIFFGLGLRTLFTRELAKEPRQTSVYLVSGSLLQLGLSIFAYGMLTIVVTIMPYSAATTQICYIMGLSIIPFALSNITEAIFQAQERMYAIALSTSPVYLLRLGVMIWIVLNVQPNSAIPYVAGVMVVSEIVILLLQWAILLRRVKVSWHIDVLFMINSFNAAKTLFAIDGAGIIAGKLDVLFISLLGGEVLTGIYGAIKQLMQPFEIICSSLIAAIFPRMSKSVVLGYKKQRELAETFLDILFCISLPLVPTVFFWYGNQILVSMYKNPEFIKGDIPLKIMMVSVILFPLGRLCNYILLANKLEKYNLMEVIATTTFGGLVGIFLISKYQLLGAACMGVAMSCFSCGILLHSIRTKLFKLRLGRILRRPLMITGVMMLFLAALEQLHLSLLVNLIAAISFYGLIAILMSVRELGGFSAIQQMMGRS
jgi:O-antigen/teichoic acid export membrane protein